MLSWHVDRKFLEVTVIPKEYLSNGVILSTKTDGWRKWFGGSRFRDVGGIVEIVSGLKLNKSAFWIPALAVWPIYIPSLGPSFLIHKMRILLSVLYSYFLFVICVLPSSLITTKLPASSSWQLKGAQWMFITWINGSMEKWLENRYCVGFCVGTV